MDYGRAFQAMRHAAGADWDQYARHAFVEGLRDGSLPREAFLHYLRQDYVFLIHFSRAWALGIVKAGTLDEMQACSATVNALLQEEMARGTLESSVMGVRKWDTLQTSVQKLSHLPEL